MDEALARASEVEDEEALTDLADEIADRLPEPVFEAVYRMMVDITTSDGEVNDDERLVLGAFAYAFGLSDDRMAEIYDEALREARI